MTEQGVTELVVRIIKGTVTLNNRPRAGGARYDAVQAHRTALELMPPDAAFCRGRSDEAERPPQSLPQDDAAAAPECNGLRCARRQQRRR